MFRKKNGRELNGYMKLSVIIVSYNEEKYLSQAIESVLQQNISDMEIIIGDDGSCDESLNIIKKYAKQQNNISYFVMERKENDIFVPSYRVSNVIKRALSIAKGEYIICLSGDDYFNDSNALKKQLDFLMNDITKKYSACITNFRKVWDDGQEELMRQVKLPEELYWSGSYIHLSCFMFRKEVYEQNKLLERFCDDTGLEYSLIKCGKWKYLNDVAFSYRQRDKSIMHEADILELSIIELLLYQDILNKYKKENYSRSRFFRPLKYVFDNRRQLNDEKYRKYVLDASKYQNNIIDRIKKYDEGTFIQKIRFHIELRWSQFLAKMYSYVRYIYAWKENNK